MQLSRRHLLALPASAALARPALASGYPDRTISLVVPYPPGGSVDGVARMLAQALGEELGQTVIVDNRAGGAGGAIGSQYVSRAKPDGYTLLLNASIHVVVPLINANITFDVLNDFSHVSLVADGPLIVTTHPSVPANTLKEFFDLVRKDPGKYNFCTSGYGSAGHLAVERLKMMAGVNNEVVAYRGGGPALSDMMAGVVQLMADPMLSSLPLVKGGQLKALAVTSPMRSPLAPEVPTIVESGMEPFDIASWYAVWGQKEMPAPVVARLNATIVKIAASPSFSERLNALGFMPKSSSPEGLRDFMAAEMRRYKPIVDAAHIRIT